MFDKDRHPSFFYDAATVISQGCRDRQEDALVCDFASGAPVGFAVLSDGMGGHDAGDVASKVVVTEVFSELKLKADDEPMLNAALPEVLRNAALGANQCIGHLSEQRDSDTPMGATLLAPAVVNNRLYWISIGDSPLFMLRDGALLRLNDEHSLGSQIDYLVESGLMDHQEALDHPDQTCLTSVIVGREIPQIDCPEEPRDLCEGDVIIAASDGLLVLDETVITEVLNPVRSQSAAVIAKTLLNAVEVAEDPDQDNVSICVIKVCDQAAQTVANTPPIARSIRRAGRPGVTIVAAVSQHAGA